MTAKAVRGLAKGIGGMTAAGVAAATFMGDRGCSCVKESRRSGVNTCDTADDIEGDTANDSADDLEGDSADASDDDGAIDLANEDGAIDLADDDVDCENDDCDDD
ncbi:hypothetical protein OIU85_013283 [Salix viminalis]|uniref:Uncharacterized protein n=1 Tax=Salix viminalis TaxID=40686 RepID=A0A9Q0NLL9_SALVM|nr:hypothetical protein OIU85_013283 [Salix viminalis]